MLLENKVALVTGAGAGIGRAIAIAFAAEGARVIVSDIDDTSGEGTCELIQAAGGQASYVHSDVRSLADHLSTVAAAIERWGRLDIACNNAGVAPPSTPLADVDPDLWERIIAVDLSGVFYGIKAQVPAMIAGGGGVIVNIGSILSKVAFAGVGPYVAAKHGVDGLTKSLTLEYAASGIRALTIGPAFIRTGLEQNLDPAARQGLDQLHPMGRMGEPQEIADTVAFLSSDRASFLNGSYVAIDGGYLTR